MHLSKPGTARLIAVSSMVCTRLGGILYVAPPFGVNRLRAPQPVEPWAGVRDALYDGPVAQQFQAAGGPAEGFIPSGRAT
ncbi:MAG: carboxylesterase family protein [Firmicutes bacterium]|nr:carboxylesterase family protein [Bacillota bacterium]